MKLLKNTPILLILVVLPALFVGVYTMKWHQVPQSIWVMNLAFVLGSIVIGLGYLKFRGNFRAINPYLIIAVSILLLLATFLNKSVLDVHRWVNLAGMRVNIGLIVSPLLLVQLNKLNQVKNAIIISFLLTILFWLQPDASLVMAFSIASTMIIIGKLENTLHKIGVVFFTVILVLTAWYNIDQLPAVDYVEGIVQLAGSISFVFELLAILSLILLTLPFFLYFKKTIFLALGIYYALLLIATIFGNFPVMIMGYGISPIIGYHIGLFTLIAHSIDTKQI